MVKICMEHHRGKIAEDVALLCVIVLGFFVMREIICFTSKTNHVLVRLDDIESLLRSKLL